MNEYLTTSQCTGKKHLLLGVSQDGDGGGGGGREGRERGLRKVRIHLGI